MAENDSNFYLPIYNTDEDLKALRDIYMEVKRDAFFKETFEELHAQMSEKIRK